MKAEDTVMSIAQMNEAVLSHLDLPMGQAIANAQAEISFKAGVKEIADWINQHLDTRDNYSSFSDEGFWILDGEWQAKLKEFGL